MKYLFLFIVALIPFSMKAQDYIYKTDSSRVEAKVLEVNPDSIKYKLFKSADTSVYTIHKENIVLVVYTNGTYDMFSLKQITKIREQKFDSLTVNYGKNFISLNILEGWPGNISLSYERILWKGKLGIKVPVIFPYTDNGGGGNNFNKKWATGLDINFYPKGQGKIRYFTGLSFEIGQYRYRRYYSNNYYSNSPYYYRYRDYFSCTINNGVLLQITPHLNTSLTCGLGVRNPGIYSRRAVPIVKFSFNLGIKF